MKLGLRNKFLLPTIALVVIAFGAATLVSYIKTANAIEDSYRHRMERLIDWTSMVAASWIKDRKQDMINLSDQQSYQTALQESIMGKAARQIGLQAVQKAL